jgi:hypothetical protein
MFWKMPLVDGVLSGDPLLISAYRGCDSPKVLSHPSSPVKEGVLSGDLLFISTYRGPDSPEVRNHPCSPIREGVLSGDLLLNSEIIHVLRFYRGILR